MVGVGRRRGRWGVLAGRLVMAPLAVAAVNVATAASFGSAGAHGSAASTDKRGVAASSACVQLLRYFYVSSAKLTETVTAQGNYDDYGSGYHAMLNTTQIGTMNYRGGLPSRAVRKKYMQYSQFTELQYSCRIPDYRQGWLSAYAPMSYSIQGNWSAGQRSGTCSNQKTEQRLLNAQYIRRSLDSQFPTVGFRWELNGPPMPGCTFTVYSAQDDAYDTRLVNAYGFNYSSPVRDMTLTKKLLLTATMIKLPINLRGMHNTGGLTATFGLRGTVVLQRYKACTIRTLQDILHGRCWDASSP
jgi:hypothetical protein